jgi:hypothetical protein
LRKSASGVTERPHFAIPAAFFRPDEGGGETRTFVIAATGARTEIDRRRITIGTP